MLRSLKSLKDSVIQVDDGGVGIVVDFLFDDEKWTVRYLVVDTGTWLSGRKILISPISVESVETSTHAIRVLLTKQQIEQSPTIDTDKPVSRQMEATYHDYYQWPYYWVGYGIWGGAPYPAGMLQRPYPIRTRESSENNQSDEGDPHLRSTHAVRGYGIEATDHHFGNVEDFIIDTESWEIRYLVIDTIKFWPSKSVIISRHWVDSISWADRKLRVTLTKELIKESPEYSPDLPINREYEERLYDYYGRPTYWTQDSSPSVMKSEKHPGRFKL